VTRRTAWWGGWLLAGALALGCHDNQDPEGARALWNAVRADGYRDWDRAPGYDERRSSNAPHGGAVDIFVNDVVTEALAKTSLTEWPEDSLIVKDGYDGKMLDLVAVMEKRSDGWYWAEYDGGGETFYSGKPDLCIDCHRSGDDFVRAFAFP
jgi:hypothetical protein